MKNKKLWIIAGVLLVLLVVGVLMGDDEEKKEPEKIKVDLTAAEIQDDEDGAHFVRVECNAKDGTDIDMLQEWYTDYFKPQRDAGKVDYMILDFADDPGRCTFYTGVTVYAACEVKDDFPDIKSAETVYMTGSNDALLSER